MHLTIGLLDLKFWGERNSSLENTKGKDLNFVQLEKTAPLSVNAMNHISSEETLWYYTPHFKTVETKQPQKSHWKIQFFLNATSDV